MRTISARALTVAIAFAVIGTFVGGGAIAATPAAIPAAPVADFNLTSYANGAWILKKPAEYNEEWSAFWLLDERAQTGWATPNGTVTPQEVLIALAEQSVIKSIEFDSANVDGDAEGSRSAKDIIVEVSNVGRPVDLKPLRPFRSNPRKTSSASPSARPFPAAGSG